MDNSLSSANPQTSHNLYYNFKCILIFYILNLKLFYIYVIFYSLIYCFILLRINILGEKYIAKNMLDASKGTI